MLVDLIHIAYQSLYILLAPLISAILLSRKDIRRNFLHMWGLAIKKNNKEIQNQSFDWLHAVSYGETIVCLQFIRTGLKNGQLDRPIIFTSTIENALNHFHKEMFKLRVSYPELQYEADLLPLDFQPCLTNFLGTRKIGRFFLFETDFWPNLIFYLSANKTKIFLINGRISRKLCSFYKCFGVYSKKLFCSFDKCFMQSNLDAERLYELGIEKNQVSVVGNAKYDLLPAESLGDSENLKIDKDTKVVLLGSWHHDELSILNSINTLLPNNFQIWIAPRVLKNLNQFQRKIKLLNSNYCLYSETKGTFTTHRFVIIDVMGILSRLYQSCDIAIIGGSFNDIGGHNFIEPILFKRPVIVGPQMRNLEADVNEFKAKNMIIQVQNEEELVKVLLGYIKDPRELLEQSVRAHNYLNMKIGGLERTWYQLSNQRKIS